MARLLPDRAAAALARAHHALPAPVHNAAFDDGSDLLRLAGTRDPSASPGALEASHELFRETLRVTRGVRVCAVLVLLSASATHEWLTASCAVFALDCVDVYRAVFAVASHNALMKREAWRSGAEQTARDVVGLARLAALAGAVHAEATAMIDSFDPIAMALEEGNAGVYTVRQHLRGCALSAAWLALVAAAAAPKVKRLAFGGTTFLFSSRRSKSRAEVSSVLSSSRPSSRKKKDERNVTITKDDKSDKDKDDDGWCGPDRFYWSLFSLDGDGGIGGGDRERVRFLETLGVAFAFFSLIFGPFLTSPSPGTGTSETLVWAMRLIAKTVARSVAVVALVGSVDANARRTIGRA